MTVFDYYIRRVWAALPVLLIVSFAAAFLTSAYIVHRGVVYEVHFSYLVSLQERSASSQYQFDGYYALQAIELFTKTLAQWTTLPETIVQAYQLSHENLLSLQAGNLKRTVTAEASAPQLVEVTVRNSDKGRAERLAAGLRQAVEEQVKQYQTQGAPAVRFTVVPTAPWTGTSELPSEIIVPAVFIFMLFAGVNAVILREGLKQL